VARTTAGNGKRRGDEQQPQRAARTRAMGQLCYSADAVSQPPSNPARVRPWRT
jgi:hypothetical protein